MARVAFPTSDLSRSKFISYTHQAGGHDRPENNNWIMGPTWNKLERILPEFNGRLASQENHKSENKKDIREKNEGLKELWLYISHSLDSVMNRVERLREPAEILTNYDIPDSGLKPHYNLSDNLTMIADRIIAGDAKTVAAGFPAMVNPTADELRMVKERAEQEIADVVDSDRRVDAAQEELASLRDDVDELIRDIVSDLNYNLRKMDDASRRRIMRSYGVTFKSDSSTEDEDA